MLPNPPHPLFLQNRWIAPALQQAELDVARAHQIGRCHFLRVEAY